MYLLEVPQPDFNRLDGTPSYNADSIDLTPNDGALNFLGPLPDQENEIDSWADLLEQQED